MGSGWRIMGGKALSFGLIYWVELLVRASQACVGWQTRRHHQDDDFGEGECGT